MRSLRAGLLFLGWCWFVGACSDSDPGPSNTGGPSSGGRTALSGGQGGQNGAEAGAAGTPSEGGTTSSEGGVNGSGGLSESGGHSSEGGARAQGGEAGAGPSTPPVAIFFLDASRDRLLWLPPRSSVPRNLVNSAGQAPEGLAVDVTHGFLYWTTMGAAREEDGGVMRAKLDGSEVTELIAAGETFTPMQLEFEATAGQLYWADREGMRLQRAAADGSALETLVRVAEGDEARLDPSNHCVGLALDVQAGWVYWTQRGDAKSANGSIRRAHLEVPEGETEATRSDVEILFEGLSEPLDLEIDPEAGYLYWTSRGDRTVNRAGLELPRGQTAASRTDREILVPDVEEALGLSLDPERLNLYYTTLAGVIGRYDLQTEMHEEVLTGGGALTGIAVVAPF